MSPGVYEDTVRLEVPVDDTHVVEVLQGQHHLPGVELHHPLREFVPLSETPEERTRQTFLQNYWLQLINLVVTTLSLQPVKRQSERERGK